MSKTRDRMRRLSEEMVVVDNSKWHEGARSGNDSGTQNYERRDLNPTLTEIAL